MSAGEVGKTAETLENELTQFLAAIARNDEDERRRYERISGRGLVAQVVLPGREAVRCRSATFRAAG